MMKRCAAAVAVFAVVLMLAGPVLAHDHFGARLRGFEETPAVSSGGQGFFFATLNDAGTEISYSLVYREMESNVTQAHIHLGQKGVAGGIFLFLCTNLAPPAGVPAPPACPAGTGSDFVGVSGTLTVANITPIAAQGIAAGEFSEVVDAIKAQVTYVNVHTTGFPSGEIRGQLTH